MNSRPLTRRELAAVLAGLRSLQELMASGGGALPAPLAGIATDCGLFLPLSMAELDALAEQLNGAAAFRLVDTGRVQ